MKIMPINVPFGQTWAILLLVSIIPQWGLSLELSALVIPYYAILHGGVTLECNFELGNDSLYGLKWYKDGHEFFRFSPNDQPQIIVFPVLGVSVNINRSSLHRVHLEPITLLTKGEYRCEVSADAPSFKTVYGDEIMRVMVLPHKGPKIYGIFPWYNIGDNFTANCSVRKSSPQAKLSWYLNDVQVESELCNCITGQTVDSGRTIDGVHFYNTQSQLHFHLDNIEYFKDGSLTVECRATFLKSQVILKDVVHSKVQAGFGLQYTDSYANGVGISGPTLTLLLWHFIFIHFLLMF